MCGFLPPVQTKTNEHLSCLEGIDSRMYLGMINQNNQKLHIIIPISVILGEWNQCFHKIIILHKIITEKSVSNYRSRMQSLS